MSEIHSVNDPLPESLNGFDMHGVHVGSATFFQRSGRWQVIFSVATLAEARQVLQDRGATQIVESEGSR